MELIRELEMNQSCLSKLTAKLVAAGWISLRAPDGDHRRRLVTLTLAGRRALATLPPNSRPWLRSLAVER